MPIAGAELTIFHSDWLVDFAISAEVMRAGAINENSSGMPMVLVVIP